MGKLSDLFAQVRKARSGRGIGFVGKNVPTTKPRAAALLVELNSVDAGSAEAAIKAGADGLIFSWKGQGGGTDALKKAVESAQAAGENVICGLHVTSNGQKLERTDFEHFKEVGIGFIILPFNAPARLLALRIKDLEQVISVPMREGELYPVFIRNLATFENLAAIHLEFGLGSEISNMSIEDVLHYRAVREAVHAPALLNIESGLSEDDAYTLQALSVQAVVLNAAKDDVATGKYIQALHSVLEQAYQEDKDNSPGLALKGN